jgi:catechol 2,3-dioxygenase-like lactoylglutathione lyase family enzyme
MRHEFDFDDGVAIGNDAVTIALFKGTPRPDTIDHVSFHLKSMAELRAALGDLRERGVELEDPGDEIGPEGPGSPHMGLWFHDPDGYRWELSVQNGAKEG